MRWVHRSLIVASLAACTGVTGNVVETWTRDVEGRIVHLEDAVGAERARLRAVNDRLGVVASTAVQLEVDIPRSHEAAQAALLGAEGEAARVDAALKALRERLPPAGSPLKKQAFHAAQAAMDANLADVAALALALQGAVQRVERLRAQVDTDMLEAADQHRARMAAAARASVAGEQRRAAAEQDKKDAERLAEEARDEDERQRRGREQEAAHGHGEEEPHPAVPAGRPPE